jgi:hypothetical protein
MSDRNKSLFQKVVKLFPFIVIFISIIIYYPSLFGAFVLDDSSYFENDLFINLTPLDFNKIFLTSSNYWGELLPIRDYLYVLEFNLFGYNTLGYHIISLLLYISSALVLFYWIKELFTDYYKSKQNLKERILNPHHVACILMAFFLLNPIYVECVAYLSGQKDILSVLFVLLSIYFLYKIGKASSKMFLFFLLGILFHYIAVLSKLSALSSILFIPVLWVITSNKKWKEIWRMIGIWIVANVPVIFWYQYNLKVVSPYNENVLNIVDTPFLERIPRAFNIIGIHVSRIIWPNPLSFGYPFDNKWTIDIYLFIGLVITLIGIFFIIKKRKSMITIGLLLFGIYLAPLLQVYPEFLNATPIYDRYLAIPLIGIFIVLIGIFNSFRFNKPVQKIMVYLFIAICVFWGILTINYIPKFKSNLTNFEHSYSLYPDASITQYRYANELLLNGEYELLEKLIATRISTPSNLWLSDYFLGYIEFKKGDFDKAYKLMFSASMQGNNPKPNIKLAEIMIIKKDYNSARRMLHRVLPNENMERTDKIKVKELIKKIEYITGR